MAHIDTSARGRFWLESSVVSALAVSARLGRLVSASYVFGKHSVMTVYFLDEMVKSGVEKGFWFNVDAPSSIIAMAFTDGPSAEELPLLIMADLKGNVHVIDVSGSSTTRVTHMGTS